MRGNNREWNEEGEAGTGRGREWDVGPRCTMHLEEREKEEKTKPV